MKFKGGDKTLSTAGGSIDVIDIFYDGTNYFAELTKAYAQEQMMTEQELIQYLVDQNYDYYRAELLVEQGIVTDKASADDYIANHNL